MGFAHVELRRVAYQRVKSEFIADTVDGRNPANQLRLVVFPIIYQVFIPPRWCRIFSIKSRVRVKRFLGINNKTHLLCSSSIQADQHVSRWYVSQA